MSRAALLIVGCAATGHALAVQGNDFATLLVFNLAVIALGSVFVLRPGELHSAWPRMATLGFGVIYVGLGLWAMKYARPLQVGGRMIREVKGVPRECSGELMFGSGVTLWSVWSDRKNSRFGGFFCGREVHRACKALGSRRRCAWSGGARHIDARSIAVSNALGSPARPVQRR